MNLAHDTVLTKSPNFMNLGVSSVHTSDELVSVCIPTTRIRRPVDGYYWLPPCHLIGEIILDRVSGARPEQNYNSKSDFETRRGGVVNQDFGRQNNSMSRPPLDSTPLGNNTNNVTTSLIDSIPVRTKSPDPVPLTLPTYFPEKNGKVHVPGGPDPYPSSLDSSSNKSNWSDDINSRKSNKKKRDNKKNCRKDKKQDSSGSWLSDSGFSGDINYRRKGRQNNIHRKKRIW